MRGRSFATTILVGAAALLCAAPSANAAKRYEVPWTVDAALFAQGRDPDSSPPGANDFNCEPSARHRQPVVLVHGLLANQTVNWRTIAPYLKNRGFCVFSLTYGTKDQVDSPLYQPGGLRTMQSSARELKAFVKRVLKRTGAEKVDIVGHSEGSLMPSWYVRFLGGARHVDDYVGMTTLWRGTNTAGLATINRLGIALGLNPALRQSIDRFCSSCRQFLRGSRFLQRLNERGVTAKRVDYTNIVTKRDELVVPYTSGLLTKAPNVTNVVLQNYCRADQAEHLSVFADPVTAGFIFRALDPKRAPQPPCTVVLPFIGAPGWTQD